MALTLDSVSFGYDPARPVVRGVSASLAPGRVTAVLGPNAAGKTTLLKLLLGRLTPTTGAVTLGGEAVASLPSARRARAIGYVPQQGSMGFAFTVRQVVAMGRFAYGKAGGPDQAVDAALASLDLAGLAGRRYPELSGGQQRRVLLARALAQVEGEGRAVLLDEPAAGLDLKHAHGAMAVARAWAGRGLAVAVVMHDLSLAARYADDAWLLAEGELVAAGGWREVMRPETLEPVYGVSLRRLADESPADGGEPRPVFVASPRAID